MLQSKLPEGVYIVIPAYNAAATIRQVLVELRELFPGTPIIVVDDGSMDQTAGLAEQEGARVLSHSQNRGSGAAIKTGFRYATEHNAQWVITMGADRQRDPRDILVLWEKAHADTSIRVVIGSKLLGPRQLIPPFRRFGAQLASVLFHFCFPRSMALSDVLSGFRLWHRDTFQIALACPNGYDFDIACCCELIAANVALAEVPVSVYYHKDSTRMRFPAITGIVILLRLMQKRLALWF